jgi:tRNA pseudouridine65 synthase
MLAFRILFEDESLVAIDKPAGFHSHPPEDKKIRLNQRWNALGIIQKQLGVKLYPAHRLDRATSGVLLLSKRPELNSALQMQFQSREVRKVYACVVRGQLRGAAELSEPLRTETGQENALTQVSELGAFSLPIAGPDGADRKFTFVEAIPVTGRFHQIRRHLAQMSLPIVGDTRHGDKKLNREFSQLTGIQCLLLRCRSLEFAHPEGGELVKISARWGRDWHQVFDRMNFCPIL